MDETDRTIRQAIKSLGQYDNTGSTNTLLMAIALAAISIAEQLKRLADAAEASTEEALRERDKAIWSNT